MVVRGPAVVDRMFARSGASTLVDIVDLDPPEAFAPSLPELAQPVFAQPDDAA
jgi:hypothetical protein